MRGIENLFHPLLRLKFAITLGALYPTVDCIIVLEERVKSQVVIQSGKHYLAHGSLCRELVIALGTSKPVPCVIVLEGRQDVAVKHSSDHGPDPWHPQS